MMDPETLRQLGAWRIDELRKAAEDARRAAPRNESGGHARPGRLRIAVGRTLVRAGGRIAGERPATAPQP